MTERTGLVTIKGDPVTLVGDEVDVGNKAPDFTCVDTDLNPVGLSAYRGKIVVISVVGSLDTSVCDAETRRFNKEAGTLGDDVVVLTISMDLPFAQKRWCGAAGIDRVVTLSDYQRASFGQAYGVLIKDLRLLARSVFVVDRQGIVRFAHIVPEFTSEPDYDAVLDAVRALI
jgi:thiol peroxidase